MHVAAMRHRHTVPALLLAAAGARAWGRGRRQPPAREVSAGASLPDCSVVFFHHVEKSGGTTLRAIFQRHAQLGLYDLISFVGRQNRLQLQLVLHRLWTLLRTPGGLRGLRLAVELHVGGEISFPSTLFHTLPELLLMRQKLRAAGCRCNLVSLARMPLLQELSWHHHFVGWKVPLCLWQPASDCATRMSLGLTCHEAPRVAPLSQSHALAAEGMWRLFDLVGVTEAFDEFVLLLADLVGLSHPAYVPQLVMEEAHHQHSDHRRHHPYLAQSSISITPSRLRRWSALSCAQLRASSDEMPRGLHLWLARKLNASIARALRDKRPMECVTYSCVLDGKQVSYSNKLPFDERAAAHCASATPAKLVRRLCARLPLDDRIYRGVRASWSGALRRATKRMGGRAELDARLSSLAAEAHALAQRSIEQVQHGALEIASGRRVEYVWPADGGHAAPAAASPRALAASRAASQTAGASCVGCSGDVVPEFDMGGCWPLWGQFAPDEKKYRCVRKWTTDPAYRDGSSRNRYVEKPRVSTVPMACWRTCWEPIGRAGERHCMGPPCPERGTMPLEWRRAWEAELDVWKRNSSAQSDARAWARLARPFLGAAEARRPARATLSVFG